MKKVFTIFIFFSLFVTLAEAYTFNNDLKVGSTGEDVLELQKILNTNPTTQVSVSGVGSPGNETNYFGDKTKQAVIKFQNIYAKELLYPIGLSGGTGYVGQLTRKKLEGFSVGGTQTSSSSVQIKKSPTIFINQSTQTGRGIIDIHERMNPGNDKVVLITNISNLVAESGKNITIKGYNFIQGSVVYIGDTKATSKIINSQTVEVTVPSLSSGNYPLKVVNSYGDTNEATPIFIKIGSNMKERPYINDVYPIEVGFSDKIIVKGTGFSDKNKIISAVGIIDDVKSSKGSITFSLDDFTELAKYKSDTKIKGAPITFKIIGDGGASTNSGYVIIK